MALLDGKVAIVTGGAQVVLTDANVAAGTQTAAKYGASFVEHDVRDEAQWESLMVDTVAK